jgi:hypothetical protein
MMFMYFELENMSILLAKYFNKPITVAARRQRRALVSAPRKLGSWVGIPNGE